MFLFLLFCYFIFSLPWGVGFGASVGAQFQYSEQLQDGIETTFSGSHLLHWEIIDNEYYQQSVMQANLPVNILEEPLMDSPPQVSMQNKLKVQRKTNGQQMRSYLISYVCSFYS